MQQTVLKFWFEEITPKQWWVVESDFDKLIRSRFKALHQQAMAGELANWRETPQGRLAEIIVLDQFSRNMYRNTPGAFASDALALTLAQAAVAENAHEALTETERAFLLMPYMHSESADVHELAVPLFKTFAPNNYDFELKHKVIIDRFGHYPHRNEILGRASTPEELEFLSQPNSGF